MRVLIDVQTLFTNEKKRGIGIYTYHWVENMLKQSTTDRFYLMRKVSDKWMFTFVSKYTEFNERLYEERYWMEENLNFFIEQKEIQIIHFTSPYMLDIEIPVIKNPTVKKSYLVYDLIPLVMDDEYYAKWPQNVQTLYNERSKRLKESDIILTISESSKKDIIDFLKIEPAKIKVIYASTNELLINPKPNIEQKKLLKEELKIDRPFIYSLTGNDPRKNNKGLISAFQKVAQVNKDLILVIGGIKHPQEQEELIKFAEKEGLQNDRLVILGYVSEETLVALYQECEIFVFPSLYEGFGLPVLEAMRCGAAVITSDCSSLPEIVGDSAIIINPLDEQALECEIKKLISDNNLRDELVNKGFKQAKKFNWEKVVIDSLSYYRELIYGDLQKNNSISKPQLAYFSPLNPQSSGISDYSEELLFYLRDYFDITIFVKGYKPNNEFIINTFKVVDVDNHMDEMNYFEKRIYHIGNNELHGWIIDTLEKYPGFVVLHDLNLFGFYVYSTYLKGHKEKFIHELIYNNGEQAVSAIRGLVESQTIPESQQFPLSNRVVDLSNGVIVHSNWVKDSLLLNNNYQGPIEVIPLGTIFESSNVDSAALISRKNSWNNNNEFKIGVFGNVIPNKRIEVIIKTISRLLETNNEVHLFIIGHAEGNYKKELVNLIDSLKLKKKVTFIDSPDLEDFKRYIKESNLCINLRWPTMGETSATLVRALSYGVPCIVSNAGSYAEYPDDCVWKVDVDEYEEELLLAYLIELINNPTVRNEMSSNAKRFIKETNDFYITASSYKRFIDSY